VVEVRFKLLTPASKMGREFQKHSLPSVPI
jgi:hypothetical protein